MDKKEDLRVKKTKKNLYEGLLMLMKDKTFEEIKVSDICEKAMTNRSTFYDHFQDKYELLSSLIHDLESELTIKLNENDSDNPKHYYMKMIELLFNHLEENLDIYHSILQNNNNSVASDMLRDVLFCDVEKHLENITSYKKDIPVDIITIYYVSAVSNVCLYYLKHPKKYNKEEILEYLDKLLPNKIY